MSVAYERLIQHLQDHEFRYHAEYERELIVADFGGKSGSYRLIARVVAEDHLFIVVGIAPIRRRWLFSAEYGCPAIQRVLDVAAGWDSSIFVRAKMGGSCAGGRCQ